MLLDVRKIKSIRCFRRNNKNVKTLWFLIIAAWFFVDQNLLAGEDTLICRGYQHSYFSYQYSNSNSMLFWRFKKSIAPTFESMKPLPGHCRWKSRPMLPNESDNLCQKIQTHFNFQWRGNLKMSTIHSLDAKWLRIMHKDSTLVQFRVYDNRVEQNPTYPLNCMVVTQDKKLN